MSNGDLAGNNKAYSMERIETVVNGQWQTKGIWHYEDWNYESVRVWDTDLFTGEVIDTENDWKEFGKLHYSAKEYRVTFSSYNTDGHQNNTLSNLAPAPEIALSKLKAIANSQSSILGGKASGEYNAKRRMEKLAVNDKPIVPTDVNGKTVDVLLYKGTTYLPVRAVANALDQAVAWDGASYSVYIGSHKDV